MGKGDKRRPLSRKFDINYLRLFRDRCRLNHAHTKECKGYISCTDKFKDDEGKKSV